MSKKNIVKEDSEFRYLEEHFEEMMEEMKKDKLTQDFSGVGSEISEDH